MVSVAFILLAVASSSSGPVSPVVCALAAGIWLPTRGVATNSTNASTDVKNNRRHLVFVLSVSRGCFNVDIYCHIRATIGLLVELYLLQETEFIRFFLCFR